MNTNYLFNKMQQLASNQDGTLTGGFLSVSGRRLRIVYDNNDGEQDANLLRTNQDCPYSTNDDNCHNDNCPKSKNYDNNGSCVNTCCRAGQGSTKAVF